MSTKARRNRLFFALGAIVAATLVACTPALVLDDDGGTIPFSQLASPDFKSYKGFGKLEVVYQGEKIRAEINVFIDDSNAFLCECFGPFGGTVFKVEADPESAFVVVGEAETRLGRADSLSYVPFLRNYPFTFEEFVRILTGRLPEYATRNPQMDTSFIDGRLRVQKWKSTSYNGVVIRGRRKGDIQRVLISPLREKNDWVLELSKLDRGVASKISLRLPEMNYFNLTYDELRWE